MKDYLTFENARNKRNAATYVAMMKLAFGEDCEILIGHHLTFEQGGKLDTENEVPSADTLLFDHDVMKAVFSHRYLEVMKELASVPAESRDEVLRRELNGVGPFIAGPDGWQEYTANHNEAAIA